MTKAGGLLTFYYKITNLAPDDRQLEFCPAMAYFYDDLGNLKFPQKTCLANDCQEVAYYHNPTKVSTKFYCNGS